MDAASTGCDQMELVSQETQIMSKGTETISFNNILTTPYPSKGSEAQQIQNIGDDVRAQKMDTIANSEQDAEKTLDQAQVSEFLESITLTETDK